MIYYIYNSGFKQMQFGKGEWVGEPDYIDFELGNIHCKIRRIMGQENNIGMPSFGGHLCAYVQIPSDHPLYGKMDDVDFDCHGGITYNLKDESGFHFIGFDCAHAADLVPSIERFRKSNVDNPLFSEINKLRKEFNNNPLFNPVYRNINYVYEECSKLARQVIEKYNYEPEKTE